VRDALAVARERSSRAGALRLPVYVRQDNGVVEACLEPAEDPMLDGQVVWRPPVDEMRRPNLRAFADHVESTDGAVLPDYKAMHRWSIDHLDDFWRAIWRLFAISGDDSPGPVRVGTTMPNVRWLPDARVNFAACPCVAEWWSR
jgi:hypothetical protein